MGSHAKAKADLPADAMADEVVNVDDAALAVFEEEAVRHAVLVKINQLSL